MIPGQSRGEVTADRSFEVSALLPEGKAYLRDALAIGIATKVVRERGGEPSGRWEGEKEKRRKIEGREERKGEGEGGLPNFSVTVKYSYLKGSRRVRLRFDRFRLSLAPAGGGVICRVETSGGVMRTSPRELVEVLSGLAEEVLGGAGRIRVAEAGCSTPGGEP